MYVLGLCVASWLITIMVGPTPACIVNLASAYLGYKFVKEINEGVEEVEETEKVEE